MHQIPEVIIDDEEYISANKLQGYTVVITGGDSGIGAATAIACAKEGANVAISYLKEDSDAQNVAQIIENYGSKAVCIKGDLGSKSESEILIKKTIERFGRVDVLINNAGTQKPQKDIKNIHKEQLENTFRTNIYSMFYLIQAAVPFMQSDACIINTTSVTAYRGSEALLDYSATKGAIVSLTRSLSQNLAKIPIRVNAVAPGPVWTPLVLTSFDDDKLKTFGDEQPLGRAAQPIEVAPAYVFLASRDSRYITGQVLHVNGGEVING